MGPLGRGWTFAGVLFFEFHKSSPFITKPQLFSFPNSARETESRLCSTAAYFCLTDRFVGRWFNNDFMDPITVALHNSSSNCCCCCCAVKCDAEVIELIAELFLWEGGWYRGVVGLLQLIWPSQSVVCWVTKSSARAFAPSSPIADADVNINKNYSPPKILRCLFKNLSRFVLHKIGARALRSESSAIASVILLLLLSIANDLFRFSPCFDVLFSHTLLFKITLTRWTQLCFARTLLLIFSAWNTWKFHVFSFLFKHGTFFCSYQIDFYVNIQLSTCPPLLLDFCW